MKQAKSFDLKKQERNIFIIFVCAIVFYTAFVLLGDTRKILLASYHIKLWVIPVILIFSLLNYVVRHARFHYLLSKIGINLTYAKSFSIFMSGIAMTVTPGKMGEVLKAYLIKKEKGNGFAEIIPLLIFERVFDGISMIIMALGGIFFFRQSLIFFICVSLLVVAFFVFLSMKNVVISIVKKFEKKFFRLKILDFMLDFFEHSQKLIRPQNIIAAVVLGIIAWSFEGISLFILVNQFAPLMSLKTMFYSMFIFSFSSIAGFLVLIPGGVGVAEGSISSFLVLFFHLSLPQAIAITIIFRFATLWFGVSMGLLFLFNQLKGLKVKEL